jgi:hypothetical protein
MKDETVGAESSSLDDFDLDSFLRDNNFLADEDKKNAANNKKQTGKRPERRVTPRRPTSDKAAETAQTEKANRTAKADENDSPIASTRTKAQANTADASDARSSRAKSSKKTDAVHPDAGREKADPNATMSYKALGEDYPEIPFIETAGVEGDGNSSSSAAGPSSAAARTTRTTRATGATGATGTTSSTTSRTRASASSTTKKSQPVADASATEMPRKRQPATSSIPAPSSTPSTSSSTRGAGGAETMSGRRTSSQRTQRSEALANPQDFQQARFTDSGYRIRGGGTRHYRGNPVLIGLVAVVVIAGIILLSFGLRSAFEALLVEKPDVSVITLTPSETREAIDSQMPHMLDYRDSSVESAYASFVDSGWNVVIDPRASSNNPDKSATGSEIIHLSSGVDPTILDHGYYQGEFDAYNFDELQQSFNGAWMFDISRGDMGFYLQLEYINFSSTSLADELERLRASQGLADANAVVDLEKVDDYGNNLIRGYSVIDEVTYYWELVGINFEEYYSGQDRRSLSEASVFVKCRIANFDFYGVSTPPAGNDSEGESAGDDGAANEGE